MAKQEIDFSPDNPENAAMVDLKTVAKKEEEAQEELEVAVGPEEEKKPDVVTLTPEEFAALKAQSDSAKAIREGIEGLGSRLSQPTVVAPPANVPTETPEEYFAKHADDIFDKEKGAAILAKYNEMVAEKKYGPLLQGLSSSLANTRKELLESRDPHFKRWKGEVEALVAQQPAEVRSQPDIYERAWASVRAKHSAEIETETVDAKVKEAVAAALKEHGIEPGKPAGRPAAHVNSEGRSAPTVSTGARKVTVRLPDAATRKALEAEAERKGLELSDLLRIKGYIQ